MTTTAGRHGDQDVKQHLPKTTRSGREAIPTRPGREAIPSEDASVRTTRVLGCLFTLLQRFKIKCFFVVQTMKETNKAGTASTIHTQNTIPDHKNMQMNTMAYVAQNSE